MFDAEAWAQRQPHTFYSHWPTASHTKCDYCGIYYKDHAPAVPADVDVSKHPMMAVKGGIDPTEWPVR